ncbi:uncharacterized protein LOC143621443 [Bidens hawaiensis]|uniref:uncharacterized protein LOC143621443 n=1 Tax=Bidens hawaiensis TaxID=980011 RepID=UPI00404B608E
MKKKKMTVVTVLVLVALMGMMAIQRVKDRRLFNVVIKDKDRQILSLRLLLQKERQYAKENKRKIQDLTAKLYSIGAQKIELNNKIMEMRSTNGSMRDEQRVLELAINEKQNQIKHKESQIQDFKSTLQTPPKTWSVSLDDPSNREVNLTSKVKVQADHQDDTKIELHNTTDGLTKRDTSLITKTDGQTQNEKSQLKGDPDVGPMEVHHEADKMDEDDAETETEADLESSRNVAEADQDYKEETEE